MKLQEFFLQAIQSGIDADPRGRAAVEQELSETRSAYEELKPEDKATFDHERFDKPYTDSRILHGSQDREMNRTRPADAAHLLDIPSLCLRTPADNMVSSFLQALEKHGEFTVLECSGFKRIRRQN